VSAFRSDLRFDGRYDLGVEEGSASASVGRRFGDLFTLRLDGGAIVGGELQQDGARYHVDPGWVVSATIARKWFGDPGDLFFFATTLTVGVSAANTQGENGVGDGSRPLLVAQDNRLGAVLGHVFGGVWSPYVAARAFGGPVFWRFDGHDVTGTDRHHYTIGLGGNLTVGDFDVSAEGAFFGERSLSIGVSHSFWDR